MKKIFQLLSTTTGLPLTGRSIALVRTFPDDGLEVSCAALGSTGSYLADPIEAGLYKVFDRTGGTLPGTDLDQLVDVASVTLTQPSLGNPTTGFLAAPDKTFREIQKTDVVGLNSELSGLDTRINNAASAILVEINNRTAADVELETKLNESLSKTLDAAVANLSAIANSGKRDVNHNIELFLYNTFKGGAPDYTQFRYKNYMDSAGGLRSIDTSDYRYLPSDICPENVFAKLESPKLAFTPSPIGGWGSPTVLGSASIPAGTFGNMPSFGITERVSRIDYVAKNDNTIPVVNDRFLRLILRVVQPNDFDFSTDLYIDVSDAELAQSQFGGIHVFILDGNNPDIGGFLNFDIADTFHFGRVRQRIRFKRSNKIMYCGSLPLIFPMERL